MRQHVLAVLSFHKDRCLLNLFRICDYGGRVQESGERTSFFKCGAVTCWWHGETGAPCRLAPSSAHSDYACLQSVLDSFPNLLGILETSWHGGQSNPYGTEVDARAHNASQEALCQAADDEEEARARAARGLRRGAALPLVRLDGYPERLDAGADVSCCDTARTARGTYA